MAEANADGDIRSSPTVVEGGGGWDGEDGVNNNTATDEGEDGATRQTNQDSNQGSDEESSEGAAGTKPPTKAGKICQSIAEVSLVQWLA